LPFAKNETLPILYFYWFYVRAEHTQQVYLHSRNVDSRIATITAMSECRQPPPSLTGTLGLYQTCPISLPYFETNPHHPNKLIFVPGLTDTIGVVPYLPQLAADLDSISYSLVQPVKSSDLGGFGTSSLEGDAQELAQLIEHIKTRSSDPCVGKLVIMGHSTGCQDVLTFLSQDRLLSKETGDECIHVDGGICQAPVSDRDYFEAYVTPHSAQQLQECRDKLFKHQPSALLDRSNAKHKPESLHGRGTGNSEAVLNPAFTAYRFASLNDSNGDDDFFSNNFSDDQIRRGIMPALSRAPLLFLMGEQEYV